MSTITTSEDATTSPISPPPLPPNPSSDWGAAVHGNCFSNTQRLGQWIGGTKPVLSGSDPSGSFRPTPSNLGSGFDPGDIYVLVHGWAPGFRDAVKAQGGNLLWWGSNASSGGIWTSDWAWGPVTSNDPAVKVNTNGFLPSIAAYDGKATILAYSWIDDSATDSGTLDLDEVYQSEAYTHCNGIRLANALQSVIAQTFWVSHAPYNGRLHIIGHSHGSKVATVAAMTLQNRGCRVAQLTILDAPESESTLEANGANLLGCYLEQMQIADPATAQTADPASASTGTFVDNYASFFGVAYAGTPNLSNVVEVSLDPSAIYNVFSTNYPSEAHSYSAAWYGGAAAGGRSQQRRLGFAWPPPPPVYLPGLNQKWGGVPNEIGQWQLQPGSPNETLSYSTQGLKMMTYSYQGNVTGNTGSGLVFGPNTTQGAYSIYCGLYDNPLGGSGYGVSIDVLWTGAQPGDYFVITMQSPFEGVQEVLLVLDGSTAPVGKTTVAISNFAWSHVRFYIYFYAASASSASQVKVSNFQLVELVSASGYLESRRIARSAEKIAKRAARAPQAAVKPESRDVVSV